MLLQLLCAYAERFKAVLRGTCEDLPTTELAGGARIRHIFTDIFARGTREVNPTKDLTDDDIRTAIKNSAGISGVKMDSFVLPGRNRLMNSFSLLLFADAAESLLQLLLLCQM